MANIIPISSNSAPQKDKDEKNDALTAEEEKELIKFIQLLIQASL